MASGVDLTPIVERLIAAYDGTAMLPAITAGEPDFDLDDAYAVLERIEDRRRRQGWRPVGRKIGFTNTTIWPRYGVWNPIWAHIWAHTVHAARAGEFTLDARAFVQPRVEPEIVFKLRAAVPLCRDPAAILEAVEWIAPGEEIVQSHFPDWKFSAPDCAAAFGLHGALVLGTAVTVDETNRTGFASGLSTFELSLSRDGVAIDRGTGSNVLGSPALALGHLAEVLAAQPRLPPLAPGEIITTGTITDAWPASPAETWSADFASLSLGRLSVRFT